MFPLVALALVAAAIPTLICVALVWWSDRYEREPVWLLIVAFTWGAIPAIAISVAAGIVLQPASQPELFGLMGTLRQIVIISPIVEESAKAIALLGLFVFFRSEIDDVLDGVVYGALIGAGFALSENFLYIMYVGATASDAGQVLSATALRSLVFGFNHAFYTAITGAAFGLAVFESKRSRRWLIPFAGLTLAIAVHMLHNLSSTLAIYQPMLLVISVLLDWGGVLVFVGIVVLAWKQEQVWIRQHLADEVPGVLSQEQYAAAQTYRQRIGLIAALLDGITWRRARLESSFQQTATELAFHKHRLSVLGPQVPPNTQSEIEQLRRRLAELSQTLHHAAP